MPEPTQGGERELRSAFIDIELMRIPSVRLRLLQRDQYSPASLSLSEYSGKIVSHPFPEYTANIQLTTAFQADDKPADLGGRLVSTRPVLLGTPGEGRCGGRDGASVVIFGIRFRPIKRNRKERREVSFFGCMFRVGDVISPSHYA